MTKSESVVLSHEVSKGGVIRMRGPKNMHRLEPLLHKVLAIIMSGVIVLGMVPLAAYADEGQSGGPSVATRTSDAGNASNAFDAPDADDGPDSSGLSNAPGSSDGPAASGASDTTGTPSTAAASSLPGTSDASVSSGTSAVSEDAAPGGQKPTDHPSAQAAITVQVKITAQAGGAFLFGPRTNAEVSSDLAESYGYTDAVEGGVSALDVLVKAHEVWLGDEFTADTAGYFLDPGNGFVQNMFGMGSEDCGFLVNSAYPGSSTVLNAQLVDGDAVDFFVLQDESSNNNHISWFTSNGAYAESVSAAPGATLNLKVAGVAFQPAYNFSSAELMHASGQAVQNAHVAWVNENGALTEIEGVASASDGSVSIPTPETEGAYRLTAYVNAGDFGYYSPPLIMSILDVIVDASASSSAGPCDLVSLEVTYLDYASYPSALTLSPVFDPEMASYTTPVVDYASAAFLRMCYVRAVAANESAVMSATLNDNGSISPLKSDGGMWSNFGSSAVLEPGNNTVTVTVAASNAPDAETKSYTVVIPMRDENGNDPDPLPGPDDPQPPEKVISSAADVPETIEEGEVYALANDIVLDSGQQITSIVGTLDGRGHTIALDGTALANTITGTVQNLGLAGKAEVKDTPTGSFAMHFSGTIQNCFSVATVSTGGWRADPGGFVADMTGGVIRNSYFSGDAGFGGAFVSSGTVANLCHTVYDKGYGGNVAGINLASQNLVDVHKIGDYGDSVTSWLEAVDVLNAERPDTGYVWVLLEGASLPILQDKNNVTVNRSALNAAIEKANALVPEKGKYTQASWDAVEATLAAANALPADAIQDVVNAAARALNDAIDALVKQKAMEPVALPQDGSVIEIDTAADLANLGADDSDTTGKYYVLTQDIELSSSHNNWRFNPFNGVLDGQGHTITLNGKRVFPHAEIGEEGVVQNIRFQGTINGDNSVFGNYFKGAVINCSSNVKAGQGYKTSGFAKYLDGGVISNCYVIGSPNNAFVETKNTGSIVNSYWEQGIANAIPVDAGSAEKPGVEMRTLAFANLMNQNKGENGTAWGQNSDGYPYFGPDLPYTEPGTEPNEHKVAFAPSAPGSSPFIVEGQLAINRADVDQFQKAGTLSLPDYNVPEGCSIEWNSNHRDIRCTLDTGELYASVVGEAVITADLLGTDGVKIGTLASIPVTVVEGEIEDIKLFVNGNDVTNGIVELAGSQDAVISVHAKYSDFDGYRPVNPSLFTYESLNQELISKEPQYASFHFEKPGEATMEVASIVDPSVKAYIFAKSTYVAAQSVRPGISGVFTVHGRNANDWQSNPPRFNPDYCGVIVEPSNASYADRAHWSVSSSDESVGVYVDDAYVPVSSGTVTYTATLTDPQTGVKVSGSSEVTYEYANPLREVTASDTSITLPRNIKQGLSLTFSGMNDAEGWSITEPSIVWTYDKEGIVSIYRSRNEDSMKRVEGAPDYNMFVLSTNYQVEAFAEGTVTVTGTPIDQTNTVAPVVFTITVTPGEDLPVVDINRIVSEGSSSASQNLAGLHVLRGYSYGDEWDVLTLLRSGHEISPDELSAYYWSVVEEVKGWSADRKPTDIERVSLALTAMGKDITNVEGVNLAAMIHDHPNLLRQGCNAVIFAMIALDAAQVDPPSGAAWTRSSLLATLLSAQHDDGGFGLSPDGASGIDITAMALQALAPYRFANGSLGVEQAIDRAVAYLASQLQKPQCSYPTSEAQSQVIIALATLGIDPIEAGFGDEHRNIFSSFMDSFANSDGGFSTIANGQTTAMSTAQALQAFESYRRYAAGEDPFWQLSAEPDRPINPKPQQPQEPQRPTTPGQSSQPTVTPTGLGRGLGGATRALGAALAVAPAAQETAPQDASSSSLAEHEVAATGRLVEDDSTPLSSLEQQDAGLWWIWLLLIAAGVGAFVGVYAIKRREEQ